MKTIYRVKSDNFNCYMSLDAYREARTQMSTGDFHIHKCRPVKVSQDTIDKLCSGYKIMFLDFNGSEFSPGPRWCIYRVDGTLEIEAAS